MQRAPFLIEGEERFGLRFEFREARLQDRGIVIISPDERAVAVGANRPVGKTRAHQAGSESAPTALQATGNSITHGLLGNLKPDRQVERLGTFLQDLVKSFCLPNGAREAIENESIRAVQVQPIGDELNDNVVRHEPALFRNFIRLQPERRSKLTLTTQDRSRRSDRNRKMPRNHLRLRPLSGTGRAEEHDAIFHLATVEKNRHPADHQDRDTDIKPHQRPLLGGLTTIV
jgi:hypothetical protein